MKRLIGIIVSVMLILLGIDALAYDETAYGAQNTPQEILDYLAESRWAGWEVTGWVNPGTTDQSAAQAFVAVKQGKRNDLIAFRRDYDTDRFVYVRHNAAALPQVEEPIELGMVGDAGGTPRFESCYVVGGEIEEAACIWQQEADGTWNLQGMGVFFLPELMFIDTSREGRIHMSNAGWVDGQETDETIFGVYQRDLRYFSFSAFPRTVEAAREKLSNPPDIPSGTLEAKEIRFTSGRKYPVYQGPGERYGQAAGGKASVSTNDWIQVFGEKDGYIMIQYDISGEKMRIGWIDAAALPKGAQVEEIVFDPVSAWTNRAVDATDDPLGLKTPVLSLAKGAWVTWAATMGDWAYVHSSTGDDVYAFIPVSALTTDRTYQLANHPAQNGEYPLSGQVSISPGGWLSVTVRMGGAYAGAKAVRFEVYDDIADTLILTAQDNGSGSFVGGGWIGDTTALRICPVFGPEESGWPLAVSVQW